MTKELDDKWIIEGIKKGEESAFKALFQVYYAQLVVFARKVVVDDDLARDLVQDVIVGFYEKRKTLNIHTSLKAHMYQSVRNRCLNQLKHSQIRRDHHANIFVDKKNEESYVEDKLQETELEHKIYDVVKSLPDQCRKIFEMSRFDGTPNQQIADELNLSKRTVETQISKALKVLRKQLASYYNAIMWFMYLLWLN